MICAERLACVRLVVFDLDETLWHMSRDYCAAMVAPYRREGERVRDGEGRVLRLRPDARATLAELARRGYRLSAASRNNPVVGREILELLGLWDAFTHPCLEWQDKDLSLNRVLQDFREKGPEAYQPAETLFIDDWPFNVSDAAALGVNGLVFGWDIKTLAELLDLLPERRR